MGLGAAKAREIGKFAEGYSGYVQQAQEAVSSSQKSRDMLSTLPIQNFILNHAVHIRLANAMEIEALKSIVCYLFLGSGFGRAVWIIVSIIMNFLIAFVMSMSMRNIARVLFACPFAI